MAGLAGDPRLGILLILLSSIITVIGLLWAGVPLRAVRTRLCERFILGVPWGSLLVIAGLFGVYLFIQRGWWHWHQPVVVAYTAASMFDPTAWLLAGFAHSGPGHLRNNVTTTLIFGPLVEWIWGHYPRDERRRWEPEWSRTPWMRAMLIFPAGIFMIGVTAALFSWGPVIGFSVAAFALIGIVVVYNPVLALVGLVARQVFRVLWETWIDPVVVTRTVIRAIRPGWYGSAVQGHLVGFLLGVAIAIVLLRYHGESRSPGQVWLGTILVGFYLSLWSLWWVLGPEEFILFRGVGVALVLLVATGIALAASSPSRVSLNRIDLKRTATVGIAIVLLAMGGVGIGLNLAVVDGPERADGTTIEDYEIFYGERVTDATVNLIDFEFLGVSSDVRTSGVIVYSERRNVWKQTVSAIELRNRGVRSFTVGGLGWSEQVHAIRVGWRPSGANPVYQIWLRHDELSKAYASPQRTARPIVEGHEFTFVPDDGRFHIAVEYDNVTEVVPLPTIETAREVHDVTLTRERGNIIVITEDSEVVIGSRETYE